MDLTKEDREGEECSTEISLGGTPSRAALALAAAATAALVCEERREAGVPGGVEVGHLE